jgi:hypothetical protein
MNWEVDSLLHFTGSRDAEVAAKTSQLGFNTSFRQLGALADLVAASG